MGQCWIKKKEEKEAKRKTTFTLYIYAISLWLICAVDGEKLSSKWILRALQTMHTNHVVFEWNYCALLDVKCV